MVKVGMVLSGCGFLDGAEIHESVLAAYFLERGGAELVFCAPDVDQMHVVNHLTGEVVESERRNVLVESARIARGRIRALSDMSVDDVDAVVLPGGFGAAKNLSTYATEGTACSVHPDVETFLRRAHEAGLPIGAICIAPVIVARVLGDEGPALTIGDDPATARAIEELGGRHQVRSVDGITVDEKRRFVSTPAYMLGPGIADVAAGIEKLVDKLLAMVGAAAANA